MVERKKECGVSLKGWGKEEDWPRECEGQLVIYIQRVGGGSGDSITMALWGLLRIMAYNRNEQEEPPASVESALEACLPRTSY